MSARVLIAGTGSGCGKTSITCGLLWALDKAGYQTAAAKCGPDYIDPLFHRAVLGAPSRSLDLFLSGEEAVRRQLAQAKQGADITVIEGVMGFYDGLSGTDEASAHHLAQASGTPVILVADCRGRMLSAAAELQGFVRFRENRIRGILLNRCTERSYPKLKALVQEHTGLPVVGYLPRLEGAGFESRHLGLVAPGEIHDLKARVARIGAQIAESVDLAAVMAIAREAAPLEPGQPPAAQHRDTVRIAVAQDEAFCFLYEENLEILRALGAQLVFFSPLRDAALPESEGLLLPGGYPELHAETLAENRPMLDALRRAVEGGLPTIAEGGGFLALCRKLCTLDGKSYPMAGAIDACGAMTGQLARFGYAVLTARADSMLLAKGERLAVHQFHYAEVSAQGDSFDAEKADGSAFSCGYAEDALFACFSHLHFAGNERVAERFVARCRRYRRESAR